LTARERKLKTQVASCRLEFWIKNVSIAWERSNKDISSLILGYIKTDNKVKGHIL